MSYERLGTLTKLLQHKTMSGELKWEETESENVFQTSFPNFSIRMDTLEGPEGPDIRVKIINKEGTLIEVFTDRDIKAYMNNSYEILTETYETARRQAKGVEDALDEIIQNLSEF